MEVVQYIKQKKGKIMPKCEFCGSKKNVREYGDEVYSAFVCDSEECHEQFGERYVERIEEQQFDYGEME